METTDLRRLMAAIPQQTLLRGRELFLSGAVLGWRVSPDGTRIDGRVAGGAAQPYDQAILLKAPARGTKATGFCSCPVQKNCKHVVAVLLAARAGLPGGAGAPATQPPPAPALPFDDLPLAAPPRRAPPDAAPAGDATAPPDTSALPEPLASQLSGPLKVWFSALDDALSDGADEPFPAEVLNRLIYVIHVSRSSGDALPEARFQPMSTAIRKSGTFGPARPYDPANIHNRQPAKFLRASDRDILADMDSLRRFTQSHSGAFGMTIGRDPSWARLLTRALATGRCRWEDVNGPALAAGPTRRAAAAWQTLPGSRQRLSFEVLPDETPAPGLADGAPVTGDPATGDPATGDPATGDPPPGAPATKDMATNATMAGDPAGGETGAGAPRPEPACAPAPAIDAVLPTTPPMYVDRAAGLVGPLDLGLPAALAQRLAALPDVSIGAAQAFGAALTRRLAAHGLADRVPLPAAPRAVATRAVRPQPRLDLFLGRATLRATYAWQTRDSRLRAAFDVPMGRLSFNYGAACVDDATRGEQIEWLEDDVLIVAKRDRAAEAAAALELQQAGLTPVVKSVLSPAQDIDRHFVLAPAQSEVTPRDDVAEFLNPDRYITFSAETAPDLERRGWQVVMAHDYPYRIAEGDAAWWADIGEGSGIDWFSFEIGVTFEGVRIDLAARLASMLARLPAWAGELAVADDPAAQEEFLQRCAALTLYQPLPDGRLLPLPGERVAPILRGLYQLLGPRPEHAPSARVGLHRAQAHQLAGVLDALHTDVASTDRAQRLAALGRSLQPGQALPEAPPPEAFKAALRPYQATGVAWLEFLRTAGFGGVLADDMGLGKTVQALAFLTREKAAGRLAPPALIVAPTSVLPNWQAEAARFAPDLKLLTLHGQDRRQRFHDIAAHDLVLTTYPLLMRDQRELLGQEFHVAILDEAQAIKNPRAAVSAAAHRIRARHRVALTGTPLENHLGEVWSLFAFLSPGLLGDEAGFRRTFRTPIEKHGDRAAQAFLTRRLKPFMLRRTKEDVAGDLPPRTEIIERIRLDGAQRDLYESVRALMHDKVRHEIARRGLAKSHIVFLDALLKLRQVCCDPRLLKTSEARKVRQSAKLERLMEMIPDMIAEGRRILVFSQFTSMLALIEAELATRQIPFVMLTGDTADRATPVAAFQAGSVPVFLLSLKAGGTGLNLTAADTVIHYDPWWNPAVERQASDRAHRIGQTKPVFVYKLLVEEGIEEAIETLKARKADLAAALFEGSARTGLDLSEDDIAALFAPLAGARAARA